MRFSLKTASAKLTLSIILLSFATCASAGPKEDVAAAASTWAAALGEDEPDKVLQLYSDDAVLWGTLSPTVRADRSALRDYFVTAFRVLPGLKVSFGDQLIRVYGSMTYRLLYLYLRQGRRNQDIPRALQLHLRKERRELAHCRPSFLGHAPGARSSAVARQRPRALSQPSVNDGGCLALNRDAAIDKLSLSYAWQSRH